MRKRVRDLMIELLPTIWEGVKYAKGAQPEQASLILGDCYDAVNSISNNLESGLTEERFAFYRDILIPLKDTLEALDDSLLSGRPASEIPKNIKNYLAVLKKELLNESEVKIEIVFMPYKSSMWDSFESIWLAAQADERCNAIVMPIPYYDRNPDHSLGEFHYEGEQYPDYVPVVHYKDYDVSARMPDVIYIHNPYDDTNFITTVDPQYYSLELKKFTPMLVYVPYFISGAYLNTQTFAQKHIASCIEHVDKIIAQSSAHKKMYVESGIAENKILALGSPKLDFIVNKNKDNVEIPTDWVQKLDGKKVIVLNSSIGALLNDPNYLIKLKRRISTMLSYQELALIWRPHPLLESAITSMKPEWHDNYKEIVHIVENCGHAIIDYSASTMPATIVSDGMISDMSSWARQYIATGKPVLMLNGRSKLRRERICLFDHFSCYFVYDGFSIEEYCELVIKGTDYQKEARMNDLKKSVLNNDGSCGEKINERIIRLLG
ncbi:CDP-glycerol glycerophosphotransferase family protein [Paenibacillus camerounensis]|uniref:CDP-glycerol glycerophosphotransferase family protein n=1 Tax=Paenibacillus camerounensis TaxID=1243663 RepID=UPI0006941890|nr:CDP-glycerol glycerophosphotransferase family protein [Paenibacillus camerounensis]